MQTYLESRTKGQPNFDTYERQITTSAFHAIFSNRFLISSSCFISAVNPVDDQAPKVKYLAEKVQVLERGVKILTKEIISGTDEDTDDENLTFLIVSGPSRGVIEKQGIFFNKLYVYQNFGCFRICVSFFEGSLKQSNLSLLQVHF